MVRLLVRQERQHFRLPDDDGGGEFPGSGRAAGDAGRRADAGDDARGGQAHEERRKTLNDIVEIAAKFFEATLATRAGARGRGYLLDRGISAATQLKFRLGYAVPDQYALKEHLGAAKISVEDMAEAGLVVTGEDIAVPYDRFRDRVMFPISDWRGRVIAFGGRALEKEVSAKYLNSPETPLFHKGATLYNIAAARKAAHEGARLIAVEGYVDVIAMATAGFEATVAPLGTALTAEQLALMWRMADEPVLCFDGDDAGRRAAYRAIDIALPLSAARQEPEIRRRCRTARIPTISPAPAAATPSRTCLARHGRWRTCCGPAKAKRARSIRRSAAPRLEARLERGDIGHRRRNRAALLQAGFFRAAAPNVRAGKDISTRGEISTSAAWQKGFGANERPSAPKPA